MTMEVSNDAVSTADKIQGQQPAQSKENNKLTNKKHNHRARERRNRPRKQGESYTLVQLAAGVNQHKLKQGKGKHVLLRKD